MPCYCAETSTRNCPEHGQGTVGEREGLPDKARALAHRAVTEGVNLKYVDLMRRELYAMADALATAEARVAELTRERELYKRQLDRTDEELPPWEGETDPPVAVGRVQTIRNLLRDRRQLEVYREVLYAIQNEPSCSPVVHELAGNVLAGEKP